MIISIWYINTPVCDLRALGNWQVEAAAAADDDDDDWRFTATFVHIVT